MKKITITQERQQAINLINALSDESSQQETLEAYVQARKVFARVKAFASVEKQMFIVLRVSGYLRDLRHALKCFADDIGN